MGLRPGPRASANFLIPLGAPSWILKAMKIYGTPWIGALFFNCLSDLLDQCFLGEDTKKGKKIRWAMRCCKGCGKHS